MGAQLRHAVHVRCFQERRRLRHEPHEVIAMIVTEHQDDVSPRRSIIVGPGGLRRCCKQSGCRCATTGQFQEIAPA
jgi:hypothetical protein